MSGDPLAYFDAHCHLQDERLSDWLESGAEGFESLGIRKVVVNGTRPEDWPRVLQLADRYAFVVPSLGLHPWHVGTGDESWRERLSEYLDTKHCCVGEIGLDRWIDGYDSEAQAEAFRWQFRLARKRGLPVTIHCLRAWGQLFDLLREEGAYEPGFLLHSYGGPVEMVEAFAALGARFSFSGYFARPDKAKKRAAFERIPIDRLLVETDAPDMRGPPEVAREAIDLDLEGKLNSPHNLPQIYEYTANLRGIPIGEFSEQVEHNFNQLFVEWAR